MKINSNAPTSVNQYISLYPEDVRVKLESIREIVRKLVPQADEVIRYGIPTYRLKENLVHFAAYKNHIGFYPSPNVIKAFESELKSYKQSKGSIQFPVDQSLPLNLIEKMVNYRLEQIGK